mgnify:CR=1 FL=1
MIYKNKNHCEYRSIINDHLASNVLLYGDAGTGKSATVKAIANEYSNKGSRLIELGKNNCIYYQDCWIFFPVIH